MMVSPSGHVSLTSPVSQDGTMLQRAVAMLGPDWQLLNPPAPSDPAAAAIGTSLPAVLANPAFGVILLDIAPRISPAAVEQFRAMLDTEGFARVFPGNLPVVHRVLPPAHLGRLPDIIDYAFSWEPPLTVRHDAAWVEMLRDLLTGAPVDAGVLVGAAGRGKMRAETPEAYEKSVLVAQRSPSALLLAGCGLLIAIGGATAAWWQLMATEPEEAPYALAAGDEVNPAVPMTSGGGGWKEAEPPTIRPSPVPNQESAFADAASASQEPLNLANGQAAETSSSRLDDQTKSGVSVPGITIQNEVGPKPAGGDVAAAASSIGDVPVAEAALTESEQVLGPDSRLTGATLARPEDVATAARGASAAPDGPADAQQLPIPNDSVAGVVAVRTDSVSGMSTAAESVVTIHATSPEALQPTPEVRHEVTSPPIAMASVESSAVEPRTGTIGSLSHDLQRPPDALLSALLQRGDAMLALGDVSAARLFYERAAAKGSGRSATALGKTYEWEVLAQLGARGIASNAVMAARWYRVALALGDVEAGPLLARVERLHP
jgi:hypothetical protein